MSLRLTLSIREAERDSYYDLIGATESYWRAFQTNGTPAYHRARLARGFGPYRERRAR